LAVLSDVIALCELYRVSWPPIQIPYELVFQRSLLALGEEGRDSKLSLFGIGTEAVIAHGSK
jgi:hypothetical protein